MGDIVIVTYTDYNDPPIITNVYNKTAGIGEDGRSILSVDKVETDGLIDIYRITYSKEPVYSYFQVKNGEDGLSVLTSEAITDLNNAIETGFYNCYSADNAPSSGFYTVEVNTDGNNVIQTATNANGEMYTRIGYDVQNNPSWGAWIKPNKDTASEILTKLKTVDGTGSGLDADLLDGHNSDYFATASTVSSIPVISTGSFTISSVTANTNSTIDITMPTSASVNKCVFWTTGGIAPYYVYCSTNTGNTWTIQHRWFGSSTNRIVYYAYW